MIREGDLVGERYRVESRVGAGAMGVVWKARDQRLGRDVAIKQLVLRPGLEQAEADRINRRARREAQITAQLQHTHAIAVYDVIEQDSQVCLIMEYLPSVSLAFVLRTRGVLASGEVAEIGRQIAAALSVAHKEGVVHRDIKPANVLLDEDGTAKVTDFGIARGLHDNLSTASIGTVAGTLAYLAPEVAQGGRGGLPADVFSLGATLYAAIEGQPPFGLDDNAIALLHRVAFDEIRPPTCSDPLRTVLMHMLDRRPDERPTMRGAHDELAAISGVPETAETEETPASREEKHTSSSSGDALTRHQQESAEARSSGGERARADRKHRMKTVLASTAGVVGFLSVVALVLVVLVNRNGSAPTRPDQPNTGPPPAAAAPAPATNLPSATANSPRDAVMAYYTLVPGNLPEGWKRLTDAYKQTHVDTFDKYENFWNAIDHVEVRQIESSGDGRVNATIHYVYKDGHVVEEQTTYGLVPEAGQWMIDTSSVITSRTAS